MGQAHRISGLTTDISVNVGQTIFFQNLHTCCLVRYRYLSSGYYQGMVGSSLPSRPRFSAAIQPSCLTDSSTGLIDCGTGDFGVLDRTSTATSGIYYAKLLRLDTGEASPLSFVVRNDSSHSDILVQTSDPTWQAYNATAEQFLFGKPGRPRLQSQLQPASPMPASRPTWISSPSNTR